MPSIKDVAKMAGVTIGTVSRAFNGYSDISETTKERIFAAAAQLDYKPNVMARNLSSKVSSNIGVLVVGLLDYSEKDNLTFSMLKGILTYTHGHNLETAIYGIDSSIEKRYVDFCEEHSIAGVILSGITVDDPYINDLIISNIPCVTIDVDVSRSNIGCVTTDNVKAMYEITDYVIKMGHRNIVTIAGKKNAMVTVERTAGFFEACRLNHVPRSSERFFYCDYSEQKAYEDTLKYLKKNGKKEATAFICMSDVMALGVLRAIHELGYQVPDDFSVTGFDGIPITEYTNPPLTTIVQNMTDMGYEGVNLLHKIIRNEPYGRKVFIDYTFRRRNSVKDLNEN